MKIIPIDKGIKIFLNANDMEKLNIGFEDFSGDKEECRFFLSGIISVVRKLGIAEFNENVNVQALKSGDKLMLILTEYENEKTIQNTTAEYTYTDINALCGFCRNTLQKYSDRILSAKLYFYDGSYFLVVNFRYAKSTFTSKNELKSNSDCDEISIAKKAEYGELISDTPLERILSL